MSYIHTHTQNCDDPFNSTCQNAMVTHSVNQHMNATLSPISSFLSGVSKTRYCRIETEVSNIQQPPFLLFPLFGFPYTYYTHTTRCPVNWKSFQPIRILGEQRDYYDSTCYYLKAYYTCIHTYTLVHSSHLCLFFLFLLLSLTNLCIHATRRRHAIITTICQLVKMI